MSPVSGSTVITVSGSGSSMVRSPVRGSISMTGSCSGVSMTMSPDSGSISMTGSSVSLIIFSYVALSSATASSSQKPVSKLHTARPMLTGGSPTQPESLPVPTTISSYHSAVSASHTAFSDKLSGLKPQMGSSGGWTIPTASHYKVAALHTPLSMSPGLSPQRNVSTSSIA